LNPKVVLFTDLDGTLLDKNYAATDIEPILRELMARNVSIVLASSKTRAEVESYRQKFGLDTPFIIENGSAVFIPDGYFKKNYNYTKQIGTYRVIQLGVDYATLRKQLAVIRKKTGLNLVGFGDMTVREVADDSGLPTELAVFAKLREYDEPFKIVSGSESDLLSAIKTVGLCYTKGGRYYHLLGDTDKGKAVEVLQKLYHQEYNHIVTMAAGDGENDLPMLKVVDRAFFIDDSKSALNVWQEIADATETYFGQVS
jgi:mannosyl-3-phosphoglycerate phosphatase